MKQFILIMNVPFLILINVCLTHLIIDIWRQIDYNTNRRFRKFVHYGAKCLASALPIFLLLASDFLIIWISVLLIIPDITKQNSTVSQNVMQVSENVIQKTERSKISATTKTKVVIAPDYSAKEEKKKRKGVNASDYSNFEHTIDDLISEIDNTERSMQ